MTDLITFTTYHSPCGDLKLGSYGNKLCLCDWQYDEKHNMMIENRLKRYLNTRLINGGSEITDMAAAQLDQYFSGKRTEFSIPLLSIGTDFQKQVWNFLNTIGYGTTMSYTEEALLTGYRSAVRAVANANGANAISIFIPCHRVIGCNGSIKGYSGGPDTKKFLIDMEKSTVQTHMSVLRTVDV